MSNTLEEFLVNFAVGMYGSLSDLLGPDLTHLFVTAMAISVFGIIIGTFYKNFSRERFFVLEHIKGESKTDEAIHLLVLLAKYTFAFPLITFVWFMFLTIFLVFLGDLSVLEVMFIALAVVAATRITAYWDEGISEDLAKMLPLGLLAFFICNPTFLDAQIFEEKIYAISQVLPLSVQFLMYIVILEWVLRICVGVKDFLAEHKEKIIPAPVLARIPKKMPTIPRKITIPRRKPSSAQKPGAKNPEEKPKKKKGKGPKDEDWELGVD